MTANRVQPYVWCIRCMDGRELKESLGEPSEGDHLVREIQKTTKT